MNKQNQLLQPINWASLGKRALVGAAIALALIALFLSGVKESDPSWPRYWYIRPLLIVPLAGACGGAFYYFIDRFSSRAGLPKIATILIGLIVYVIGLWLGTILGLDGTLWD
jgi:hypothetical protein